MCKRKKTCTAINFVWSERCNSSSDVLGSQSHRRRYALVPSLFYINFVSLAYVWLEIPTLFCQLKIASTKLTRVRQTPLDPRVKLPRAKKKSLLIKNWKHKTILFYSHLFRLIQGCVRSPKSLKGGMQRAHRTPSGVGSKSASVQHHLQEPG